MFITGHTLALKAFLPYIIIKKQLQNKIILLSTEKTKKSLYYHNWIKKINVNLFQYQLQRVIVYISLEGEEPRASRTGSALLHILYVLWCMSLVMRHWATSTVSQFIPLCSYLLLSLSFSHSGYASSSASPRELFPGMVHLVFRSLLRLLLVIYLTGLHSPPSLTSFPV